MKVLDAASALLPGVELWLMPPLEQSPWTRKIDWYLGFQLRRAGPHRPAQFSGELNQIVQDNEVELPAALAPESLVRLSNTSPLMIASEMLLPNHQTIIVPNTDSGNRSEELVRWAVACHKIWHRLGEPNVRVFLPEGASVAAFEKAWPPSHDHEIEVVSAAPGTYA